MATPNNTRPVDPEALATSRGPWRVTPGNAHRAAVTVDAAARKITAPAANTPAALALRRLALLRAAIDPENVDALAHDLSLHRWMTGRPADDVQRAVRAALDWRAADHARRHRLAALDEITAPDLPITARACAENGDVLGTLCALAEAQTTGAARATAHAIGKARPEWRPMLQTLRREIGQTLQQHVGWDHTRDIETGDTAPDTIGTGRTSVHCWRTAQSIAVTILRHVDSVPKPADPAEFDDTDDEHDPIDTSGTNSTLWHDVRVWRGPMSRDHVGTLARSNRRRVNTGRVIVNPSRLYTDPERRAFTRRTRGNGATVVIDCSGSMSLSMDDVAAVLDAAPGATVWAYQHIGYSLPTVWLLAHDGRAVEELPDSLHPGSGSNGLDAPALRLAAKYHSPGQPFVWVSDAQYNGAGRGTGDALLALDVADVLTATNAVTMPTPHDAAVMLDRIARGGHPDPHTLPDEVTEPLRRSLPQCLQPGHRPQWLQPVEIGTAAL